jgi:nucleoside-diphosphate-sugar epimerase/putative sterol carrier protein
VKVAVTGASGQLGTVVLRRLVDQRSVKEVVALDIRPPAMASAKLRWVPADVRTGDLERHLEGCDAVLHLAFIVTRHLPRPVVDSINVLGSRNVFRAAAAAGARRIVYTSSVAAYGVVPGHPVPIVETTPRVFQPAFAYAATKYQVEAVLDEFEARHPEIAVVRLRPGIFFGPGMEHALGKALRRGLMVDLGTAPLPVVWNEDVAEAIVLSLRGGVRGPFNLAAREPLSARELAEVAGLRLVRLSPLTRRGLAWVTKVLDRLGVGEAMDPAWSENRGAPLVVSSDRAIHELGWAPTCPTAADVIRRFVETVPGKPDRRLSLFLRVAGLAMKTTARQQGRGVSVRLLLSLTGRGGGEWTVDIQDGKARIVRGVLRPPTSVVRTTTSVFLDLLAGRTDLGSAELTGRVRLHGDPIGSMVLASVVASFRAQAAQAGLKGAVARRLARWIERAT